MGIRDGSKDWRFALTIRSQPSGRESSSPRKKKDNLRSEEFFFGDCVVVSFDVYFAAAQVVLGSFHIGWEGIYQR